MKTMKEVKAERPEYSRIIAAVYSRLEDSIEDVYNYGISGGYCGFVYYSDTVAFWRKYKTDILAMLKEDAESLGDTVVNIVKHFNCLGDYRGREFKAYYTEDEIGRALYGRYSEDLTQIYNALAWCAAENVARWFME